MESYHLYSLMSFFFHIRFVRFISIAACSYNSFLFIDSYYSLDGHAEIYSTAAAAAKSLQSCSTLCDPIDGSPPGSPVPGILQARILEWVAISFSNA